MRQGATQSNGAEAMVAKHAGDAPRRLVGFRGITVAALLNERVA